jgi:ammonia channel protein AmtB
LSHNGGADGSFNHAISALLNVKHRNKIDDSLDVVIDHGFGGGMGTLFVAI